MNDHKSHAKNLVEEAKTASFGVDTSFEFIHNIFGRFTWFTVFFYPIFGATLSLLLLLLPIMIESNRRFRMANTHSLLLSMLKKLSLDCWWILCLCFSSCCLNEKLVILCGICANLFHVLVFYKSMYAIFYSKYFLIFRGHSIAQTLINT